MQSKSAGAIFMFCITHIFSYLIMVGSLSWPSPTRSSLLWTGGRSLSAGAHYCYQRLQEIPTGKRVSASKGEREMRFTRSREHMERALGEQGSLLVFLPRSSRSLPRAAPRLAQILPVPPPSIPATQATFAQV